MYKRLHSIERSHLLAIILFGLVLYAPSLFHEYALDDEMAITGNTFTRQGLFGIGPLLATDTWHGFFGEDVKLLPGGRYRPLSLVTFAVEQSMFGGNPTVSHLLNILIHALTGGLIYLLLLSLFPPNAGERPDQGRVVALLAAVIFLAHPLHTEVVANIKGRDELLALILALAALMLFLAPGLRLSPLRAAGGSLLLFLAILAKENAYAFVAIIPLTAWFFRDDGPKRIKALLPWVGGSALLSLALRFAVLGGGGRAADLPQSILNDPFLGMSLAGKYATIMHTLGRYLLLLVFPHPLTHDYYPRTIPEMSWGHWSVIASLLLYLGALGWALWKFRSRCHVSWLVLFYLISLFTVSNIPFTVGTAMGERFLYMPSLAFCCAAALVLYRCGDLARRFGPLARLTTATAALLIALVVIVPYCLKTLHRIPAWKDNLTLFSTDIAVSDQSAKLQNALGCELLIESARPENASRRQEILDRAGKHLRRAVEIYPGHNQAWIGLGDISYLAGSYADALGHYDRALAVVPDSTDTRLRKAQVLADWGKVAFSQGHYAEARERLRKSVAMEGENPDSWVALGAACGKLGLTDEAIRAFQRAITIDPRFAPAYLNLGAAYSHRGDRERGRQYFEQAYRLDPSLRP